MAVVWTVVLLSICGVVEPPGIDFQEGNVLQARELAAQSGKMVLVEIYASWCASCLLMEQTTLRSSPVIERVTSDFIAVRLNADEPEGKLFAIEHNVQMLPALIVTTSKGNVISQVEEALGQVEMIRFLDTCGRTR